MASLEEFSQTTPVSMGDFSLSVDDVAPVSNKPSNLNLAAHAAAFVEDPTQVLQAYDTSNAELDMEGKSAAAQELLRVAREKSVGKTQVALSNLLVDPTISDAQKQAAALGALDNTNEMYNTSNILSRESVIAPAGRESVETETARVSLADSINEINAVKRDQQALFNAEIAKSDPNMRETVEDVINYLMPFAQQNLTGSILDAARGGEKHSFAEAFTLLGDAKMDIKKLVENVPPEKRLDMTKAVINMINQHSAIAMPDDNDFARVDMLRTVLQQGYYEDGLKWVDNIVGVLDLTMVGGAAARAFKGTGRAAAAAEDLASNATREQVRSRVQPSTVSQNYKDTNPAKATAAHELAASDESGEAAQALYGTNRADAVGNDLAPEVAKLDGSVRNKTGRPEALNDAERTPSPDVMDFVQNDGAIHYWEAEKRAMRARAVNDFEQAKGMNARKEMFTVESLSDGVGVKAIYGPPQGGFQSAEEAMAMARWSLREYGVDDSAITILQRQGSDYVPLAAEEASKLKATSEVLSDVNVPLRNAGEPVVTEVGDVTTTSIKSSIVVKRKRTPDFLVQVESKYKFNPGDVAAWSEADVKYNIFDRINAFKGTSGAGSFQRHMLDAHSMLHPNITLGANVVVDKAAGLEKELLKVGDSFAESYKRLPRQRQEFLEQTIKDANAQGIDLNYNKLVADGATPAEIATLKEWRGYWDTIYHLENKDMVKTMRARGFHEFVDEVSDTRLFVKPVSRNQVAGDVKVYNYADDTIETMRADEVAELYARDGTLARMRQPMSLGDDAAEFIVSQNSVGKNYLRALTDDSQILNYRKGYYSVNYKDPQFIVKVVQNSRGETLYEKAVATAGNMADADMMVRRMSATDGGKYYRRGDTKKMDMRSDDYWDLQQAGGRSAQKVRGKRLEDATSTVSDPSMSNIMGPVESMVQSARSISNRVAMRDMTEATKARFMSQFDEYLPTGKYGQKVLPGNIDDIKYRGGHTPNQKKLADARTSFEYIKYLDDGYINAIDDGYKATLKALSDVSGSVGLSKVERGLGWMSEARGPSAMAKNLAFNMYLATNPFRQMIIQSHQAVQLTANFPRWIAQGRAVPQVSVLTAFQLGIEPSNVILRGAGLTLEEAKVMYRQFQRTGQTASIDKQNLIRGSLGDLADTVVGGKVKKWAFMPLTGMRRIGFDAGENVNTMTSWLAHRDQAIREGKDFSRADVQDMVSGKARNYTYNMNAAGDMPYNQNALAALFQFMQVPHKAMTQMLFNRALTPIQRLRLTGFNALMYTLPPAAMYSVFGDILPDDPDVRDAVVQGMEGLVLNKLIETSTGDESRIDFSGLSPADMFGTYDFIHSLFTTDVGTVMASTPSGQLFFGNNPRVTNFAKTAARYFNLIDDYEDVTTFGNVAHDFASLSSGYSNGFKAAYALQYQRKLNTMGGITDSNVTSPEAVAQVFGFGTLDEAQKRYVNDKTYKATKAYEDDVKTWYKDFKKHIARQGITPGEVEHTTKVFGEAWRVWGNDDYQARQIISGELKKDAQAGDSRMYQSVMKATGVMDHNEVKGLIKAIPGYADDKRKAMSDTVDFIYSYKDEIKED